MTLDLVLGGIIAGFALMGFWRGVLRSMGGLIAMGGGYWVSAHYGTTVWQWVPLTEGFGAGGEWGGYVGCFVLVYAGMIIAVSMLSRMVSWSGLGLPNRLLGAGLGVLKGVLLVWLMLMPLRWMMPEQVATAVIPAWLASQWAAYGGMASGLPPFSVTP